MPFFSIASCFVTLNFWYRHVQKSNPISLDFSALFFAFPFSLVFVILLPLLTASQLLTASFQSVQEFLRKHHPKVMKSKIFPPFFSLKFIKVSVYIYLKLNITLLWVSLPVWFLSSSQCSLVRFIE